MSDSCNRKFFRIWQAKEGKREKEKKKDRNTGEVSTNSSQAKGYANHALASGRLDDMAGRHPGFPGCPRIK